MIAEIASRPTTYALLYVADILAGEWIVEGVRAITAGVVG